MIREKERRRQDLTSLKLQNGAIRGVQEANSGTRSDSQPGGGLVPRTDQLISHLFLFQIMHHLLDL